MPGRIAIQNGAIGRYGRCSRPNSHTWWPMPGHSTGSTAEALHNGVHSSDVVLNILSQRREPPSPVSILTPAALTLRHACRL